MIEILIQDKVNTQFLTIGEHGKLNDEIVFQRSLLIALMLSMVLLKFDFFQAIQEIVLFFK